MDESDSGDSSDESCDSFSSCSSLDLLHHEGAEEKQEETLNTKKQDHRTAVMVNVPPHQVPDGENNNKSTLVHSVLCVM